MSAKFYRKGYSLVLILSALIGLMTVGTFVHEFYSQKAVSEDTVILTAYLIGCIVLMCPVITFVRDEYVE